MLRTTIMLFAFLISSNAMGEVSKHTDCVIRVMINSCVFARDKKAPQYLRKQAAAACFSGQDSVPDGNSKYLWPFRMIIKQNNLKRSDYLATIEETKKCLLTPGTLKSCPIHIIQFSRMNNIETCNSKEPKNVTKPRAVDLKKFTNYEVAGRPEMETTIDLGDISGKKLIRITAKFGKGFATPAFNPGAMVLLTPKNIKTQGMGIGIFSARNTGTYSSFLWHKDKNRGKPQNLGYNFKEGEEFSITIERLKPDRFKLQIGDKSAIRETSQKLDTLFINVVSVGMTIKEISMQ